MNDNLSTQQIALLVLYAAAMAGGQMLFKLAALRLPAGVSTLERLLTLPFNGVFLAALVLYGALTVLWVWILGFTPLSRAYPFVALSFAVTPLIGALIFSEPITGRLLAGIAALLVGLFLIAG